MARTRETVRQRCVDLMRDNTPEVLPLIVEELTMTQRDTLVFFQGFSEPRHGNRRTAVNLNPLVDLGVLSVSYGDRERTWDITPLGRAVAAYLQEHFPKNS